MRRRAVPGSLKVSSKSSPKVGTKQASRSAAQLRGGDARPKQGRPAKAQGAHVEAPAAPEQRIAFELRAQARLVRRLRERRGLTLHALADKARVGLQTVVRLEAGSQGLSLLNWHKVLHALGADMHPVLCQALEALATEECSLEPDPSCDPRVKRSLAHASTAACTHLDALLRQLDPQAEGVGLAFEQALCEWLEAMLANRLGRVDPANTAR